MAAFSITKRATEAAEQGRHYDVKLAGFGLYVGATGARTYFVEYRPGRGRGVAKRRLSFARHGDVSPDGRPWTADTARAEAFRLLGQVKAGNDPLAGRDAQKADRDAEAAGKPKPGTVAAVAEDWLRRDQAGNRDAARVRRIMEREILPALGAVPIVAVRKADIICLIDNIADRAPVHANRVLAHIRRLFNWAAGRDLLDHSPAAHIEKPTAESPRDRVLCDTEIIAVWRAAERMGGPFGAGVRLLILTAARRDEIFRASRAELDMEAAALRLPTERAKAKEGRIIALSAPALDIIRARPSFAGGDWLLSVDGRRPYAHYSGGKTRLDTLAAEVHGEPLAPWRLHDLRRTVATNMQAMGVRLEAVEAVLGHVSGSRAGIVGVYQRHRFEAEAREALAAWAAHLQRLLDPTPTSEVVPLRRAR